MANSKILVPFIKSWEGGFANVKGDKGGATMQGVTLATFRQVYGLGKSVEDLKKMTPEQWHYIFKRFYWDRWKADDINSQSIANLLVDWVWGSGSYGIKIPQAALRVTIDGIVGPKTLAAINKIAATVAAAEAADNAAAEENPKVKETTKPKAKETTQPKTTETAQPAASETAQPKAKPAAQPQREESSQPAAAPAAPASSGEKSVSLDQLMKMSEKKTESSNP